MEWISVKDRMPETTAQSQGENYEYHASSKVLTWILGDKEPSKAIYNYGNGYNNWAVEFGEDYINYELDEVTHWMPLPERPINQ